ncbi:hypothetical protein [Roseovarius sp. EL26]|uniref:hypothetical protein n=1 Tax=Roseovarius sp. EL26 TaxID=2126672 RepID=UPI0013C53456|nr:hypothetical protein [Roseovarius sp. EL26]
MNPHDDVTLLNSAQSTLSIPIKGWQALRQMQRPDYVGMRTNTPAVFFITCDKNE